jgi:hypothetical protein
MEQNALTAVVPILPEKLSVLKDYLGVIGNDVENNRFVRFRETPSTHFARWVILEGLSGPRLYFSACYDGTFESYLAEIASRLGAGMETIWTCCKGYYIRSASNPKEFADFLLPYSFQPNIFLIAFPGLSARQIIGNVALRATFDDYLDTLHPRTADQLVSPSPPLATSHRNSKPNGFFADMIGSVTDWLVGVHPGATTPNAQLTTTKMLSDMEDRVVQNQMTIISNVKTSFWPRLLLKVFLFLGRFNKATPAGQLSGLSTIHFARWVLIDDGNTLLFESNYDGSWESYIDDFGDHVATNMNAVWANCDGFPKGGCLDIEAFKQVIRSHQHPAQVFFSAYPNQTVKNIATDLALRKAITSAHTFMSGSFDASKVN